jgi:PAS domain S-box-containing protein
MMDSFSVYRQQLTAMAVVGTIEFALLVVFLTEHVAFLPVLNPWPHIQLITYNLVFVAAPLGWSYLRQSLFSIQILDRQAVIENMEDAVFVFDTDDVLRRVNEPGERLVGAEPQLEGEPASSVFSDTPVLLDAYRSPANGDQSGIESVQLPVEGRERWYDVNVSRIRNSANEQTGTVLVARDVTARRRNRRKLQERTEELKQKTRRLERQNERLDQFAGVVSHDLKNPLNVAQLQFELVREEVPADDAAVIDRSLDRMEAMIDELLTMARAGTTIENREQLSLVSIVEQAWETIQDERATLDNRIDEQVTVDGDPDLLLNVFENLFHNSIEHGAPGTDSAAGITIRVGRLEASEPVGFYVEDSGRGIPEQRRDEIFEFGLTTREDGTGFGLAIVRELIRAHGWEITATSGTDGGARFEIRTDTAPDEQPSSV